MKRKQVVHSRARARNHLEAKKGWADIQVQVKEEVLVKAERPLKFYG